MQRNQVSPSSEKDACTTPVTLPERSNMLVVWCLLLVVWCMAGAQGLRSGGIPRGIPWHPAGSHGLLGRFSQGQCDRVEMHCL